MAAPIEVSQSTLDMINEMALETGMRPMDLLEHAMTDFHRLWRFGLEEEIHTLRDYRRQLDEDHAAYLASALSPTGSA